jgi:alpha-tubulin suppressor-like RCC1 family protein
VGPLVALVLALLAPLGAAVPVSAQTTSGQGWAWGSNGNGQLGNGTTADSTMPVAVTMPAGVTFTTIATGYEYSLALDTTGRVWAWGSNGYG